MEFSYSSTQPPPPCVAQEAITFPIGKDWRIHWDQQQDLLQQVIHCVWLIWLDRKNTVCLWVIFLEKETALKQAAFVMVFITIGFFPHCSEVRWFTRFPIEAWISPFIKPYFLKILEHWVMFTALYVPSKLEKKIINSRKIAVLLLPEPIIFSFCLCCLKALKRHLEPCKILSWDYISCLFPTNPSIIQTHVHTTVKDTSSSPNTSDPVTRSLLSPILFLRNSVFHFFIGNLIHLSKPSPNMIFSVVSPMILGPLLSYFLFLLQQYW